MKRQYLGDSKDSFKWDYLHYLTVGLGYPTLQVAWMMTGDDGSSEGTTQPEAFPARTEILEFCRHIRVSRDPAGLHSLPDRAGGDYRVVIAAFDACFEDQHRESYFRGLAVESQQVLFLDPDNGMEPERSYCEKHVRYRDLEGLLNRIPNDAVITVFQHHRRRKFPEDFARIKERLGAGYVTAVFWHSLMFVSVAKSEATIERVRRINADYSRDRPVQVVP